MNKTVIGVVVGLLILVVGLYMFSGKSDQSAEPQVQTSVIEIDGTSWDFADNGKLSFEGENYSASVGCNTMGGTYVLDGNSITFKEGMTTLMGCPPEVAEAETKLMEDLSSIDTIAKEGAVIHLVGGETVITLTPPVAQELTGTRWNIASIKEGSGIVSAAIDEGTFLTFESDGTFSGKSACNSVMGDYEAADGQMTVSNMAWTEMACEEDKMAREQILIETLQNAEVYAIDRDTLDIESADREYRLELKADTAQ